MGRVTAVIWIGILFLCTSGCGMLENSNSSENLPMMITREESPGSAALLSETPFAGLDEASVSGHIPKKNSIDQAVIIFIPGGIFEMGAELEQNLAICESFGQDCHPEDFFDEIPVHPVVIDGFWIYQLEVSNSQYKLCVDGKACDLPAFTDFFNNPEYQSHPVVYVSWHAAQNYCNWAGGRLPTEAEWELASRGFEGLIFPWGTEASCELANMKDCSSEMTRSVGSLPAGASPFGVMDLAGNVSEWVQDWYDPNYYQISSRENPLGPETGELKVIRGGSWKNAAVALRTTNRGANYPEVFSSGIGFRCVVSYNP